MRYWLLLIVAALPGVVVAKAHDIRASWGKTGLSMEQYRLDQRECGLAATNKDVSQTGAAKTLATASRQLDNLQTINTEQYIYDSERIKRYANPERQWDQIRLFQQQAMESCLIGRGYRQFILTGDQRSALGRLTFGSAERRDYLFALATDPDVLARQGVDPQAVTAVR